MKKNLIILIVVYMLCSSCSFTEWRLNGAATVSDKNMKGDTVLETAGKTVHDLSMFNNPLDLNSEDELSIWLNDTLVYKGNGDFPGKAYFPESAYAGMQRADIEIKRGNKFYYLFSKRYVSVDRNDKFLYLVFCPDNGRTENFILFGQEQAIL